MRSARTHRGLEKGDQYTLPHPPEATSVGGLPIPIRLPVLFISMQPKMGPQR